MVRTNFIIEPRARLKLMFGEIIMESIIVDTNYFEHSQHFM